MRYGVVYTALVSIGSGTFVNWYDDLETAQTAYKEQFEALGPGRVFLIKDVSPKVSYEFVGDGE